MSVSRRRFLESASMTVLASAVVPSAIGQTARLLKDDPFSDQNLTLLNNASAEMFKPYVGDSFSMLKDGARLDNLTLLEVATREPAQHGASDRRMGQLAKAATQKVNCFALRFKGSGPASHREGTYVLQNHSLGNLSLFLQPGAPGMKPATYTATFALLVQ